jgi:hypothetical protein
MIEDGSRQPIVFNEGKGVVQRVGRGQSRTGRLELLRDIHDDKGFILNDKDGSPVERGVFHQLFQRRG